MSLGVKLKSFTNRANRESTGSFGSSSGGIAVMPPSAKKVAHSTVNERAESGASEEVTSCSPSMDLLTHVTGILKQSNAISVDDELVLFRALRTDDGAVGAGAGWGTVEIVSPDRIEAVRYNIINRIVKQNLPLVHRMRMRFPVDGLDLDEMLSEGSLALYRAAKGFDPERGFRFSTYACRSIRYAFVGMAKKRQREQETFKLLTNVRSDTIHRDDSEWRIDGRILMEKVNAVLAARLAGLKEVECFVLERRFLAASTDGTRTLAAVGGMLKISKERVRQIEVRAVAKLRAVLCAQTA